jgi:hypothetical protein
VDGRAPSYTPCYVQVAQGRFLLSRLDVQCFVLHGVWRVTGDSSVGFIGSL